MTRRTRAGGVTLAALFYAAAAAAPGCRRDPLPAASTQSSAAAPVAPSTPSAYGRARAAAAARLADPRWRAAAGEDPLDHARLAAAEGAAGLLDALDDGGDTGAAALRALPYADDAELALGPLTERAAVAPPASLRPLLQAILQIEGRPPRPREPLDPEGARAAAARLLDLCRRRDVPPDARALAISAARAAAEHGYLDPAAVPADLDAPPRGGGAPAAPSGSPR